MFTTPRKTGASTQPKTPNTITPLRKGLFSDGTWCCNCSPRLPAAYFHVKKDGPNKGRGFYTCTLSKQDACGFFLWEDEAIRRESQTIMSNSKSTVGSTARNTNEPTNQISLSQSTRTTATESEDEDFGEWPLTKEDETEVAEVVNVISQHMSPAVNPETPRKAIRTSYLATPSTKRKRDDVDSLPTPMTNNHESIPTAPSTSKRKTGPWNGDGQAGSAMTPNSGRFRDVEDNYDITEEVLELLKPDRISERTSSAIREVLNKYALQASGVSKARDLVRASLKSKDNQIATLQQRISALEAEREVDKAFIRKCKGDIRHYGKVGEATSPRKAP